MWNSGSVKCFVFPCEIPAKFMVIFGQIPIWNCSYVSRSDSQLLFTLKFRLPMIILCQIPIVSCYYLSNSGLSLLFSVNFWLKMFLLFQIPSVHCIFTQIRIRNYSSVSNSDSQFLMSENFRFSIVLSQIPKKSVRLAIFV